MIEGTTTLEAALAYALGGWRVFPCRPADAGVNPKAPYVAGGHTNASSVAETVRETFIRFPDALIGLVPASAGFVVLDLAPDVRLEELPVNWLESLIIQTPSGSFHVYFKARGGAIYGNGNRPDLGPLVDVIRHADGYVIVPPAPGYRVFHDRAPLDAPPELELPERATSPAEIFGARTSIDDRVTIPAGGQEHAISQRALHIARYRPRPSEAEAAAQLWRFVQDRCPNTPGREPWTQRHVEDKIRRAFTTPIERPIDVSADGPELALTPVLSIDRKIARFVPGMRLRVPEGTITVVTGQQGAGKGLLFASEAVGVARQGGGVLIASDEDSAAHTIRPRLEVVAGGDFEALRRVHMLSGLTMPKHVQRLIEISESHGVRLLVVDPWTNHVGSIDVDKNQELRAALMALAEACDRTRMVAVLVAHPNKNSENPDPLERVAHASALTQVARSAFWIVRDPREDHDEHDRLLAHVKHNLTARAPTIEYRIETRRLEAPDQVVPLIVEQGTDSDLDWLEIHKLRRKRETAKPAEATLAAEQAILAYLEQHAPAAVREAEVVSSVAEAAAVGEATVKRSGRRLEDAGKITRSRRFGWSLASDSNHQGDD